MGHSPESSHGRLWPAVAVPKKADILHEAGVPPMQKASGLVCVQVAWMQTWALLGGRS